MFEKILNTSGIMRQDFGYKSYNAKICNVNNSYNIVKADNSDNIIGYRYNGITMMLPNGVSIPSDKLLTGSYLYNKFNIGVAGTMPNNGELNYTPSTSQQTIPSGYTSGGIVEPINLGVLPYSIDNISSSEVTNPSSYTYTFVQNANGYYESNNKGKDNSFAMCKLSFVVEETSNVSISYINSGEANYDFGIFSNLDTTLQANNNEDTSNVKKSCKGDSSTAIRTLTYSNVSVGEHFIYIKFRKDGSSSSGNDSLQFKLNITKTTTYIKNKIYASVEDMNNDITQEINTYALIFDTNTFKMTEMYKWDGTKWIKTEELSLVSTEELSEMKNIISDLFGNSNYTYDTPIYDLCKTDTIVNDIGSTKFNIVDISAENTIKDRDLVESIASALENSEKSSLGIYITVYDTVNKTANVSVNGCVQPYIYAYKNNDQIKLNIMLQNNAQNENYILYVDGLTNTFSGVSENGWYHRYDYNDFDGSYLNVQYIGDLPQSVYNNVLSHQYAYNIVDYSHNSDNLKLAAKILDSIIHLKIEEVN